MKGKRCIMLEEIKSKIKNNPFCDLSIEELIKLSEVNDYNEYVKIFDKKHVAHIPEEINENTICYIGDLYICNRLPTYNLKYVFGRLYYDLDVIYNLENLCFIGGEFSFSDAKDLSDLFELFENKKFILYAVKQNSRALEYVSEEKN